MHTAISPHNAGEANFHTTTMRFAQTLKFMSFNIRFDGRSRGHDLRVANLGCIDMPKGIDWGNPLQQVFGKISLSVQRDAPAEPPKSIWGETPWVERQEKVADTVLFYDPDVVGFQEVLVNQMKDLTKLLGDDLYDHVGVGRDDGKEAGEYVPIFYKREKLELVDLEHIWLSNVGHSLTFSVVIDLVDPFDTWIYRLGCRADAYGYDCFVSI